jgi:hypothetical protein
MSQKTIYCGECLEDIPNAEVQWEDNRLYCGRCGSELAPDTEDRDLLDEISSRKPRRLYSLDDDDDEDEEDEDLEEEEDEDWEDEEDEDDVDEEDLDEEGNGNGRPRHSRNR